MIRVFVTDDPQLTGHKLAQPIDLYCLFAMSYKTLTIFLTFL